jgi:hypothetical protein
MPFCGNCGTQLGRKCPACQFVNPLSFIYCGMCGVRIQAEAALAPALASENIFAANGIQPEAPSPSQLVGERRIVTVILADVRKSTDLQRIGTEACGDHRPCLQI